MKKLTGIYIIVGQIYFHNASAFFLALNLKANKPTVTSDMLWFIYIH